MQNTRLSIWLRILLFICGAALICVLFVPIWRIDLSAPQYPEGLRLRIFHDKLAGNVDIINGLNHYIGMKTLHTDDFIEFNVLRYFIVFYALGFMVAGIMARKNLLYWFFILFVAFGILAMYDFWRWEYNYGHHLNPEAAIIVPGMSYQPPLIGYKQLLNFGAYSIPDIGGWIFAVVGAVLLFCVSATWFSNKKKVLGNKLVMALASLLLVTMLSCNVGPEAIKTGTDNCSFCKMTMSDARFGAEIVTKKGKIYKFDDMNCIMAYLRSGALPAAEIKDVYLTDFCNGHKLINAAHSYLLQSDAFKSPMNGNTAAFDNPDSLQKTQAVFAGTILSWNELNK